MRFLTVASVLLFGTPSTLSKDSHLNAIDTGWGWKKLSKSLFSSNTRNHGFYYPQPNQQSVTGIDNRTLDELYRLALKEDKGDLIIYAGGDTPDQQDFVKQAFESKFPGINLQIIVDFSKNHNGRIDYQLSRNSLVPDIAQLQTLHDFERWKRQGVLLPYKGIGWDQVYSEFKDDDGYFTAVCVIAFSNNVNIQFRGPWPSEANDYLSETFRRKIVSTWPNDDDAVLFLYKLFIDKYGWDWLRKFVDNQPLFVRGTQAPYDLVQNGTEYVATFTTAGSLRRNDGDRVVFVVPKKDPFVSWGQRAAIFARTKKPNAAKLYMSWWLDYNTQSSVWDGWSVRKDVPVPKGFKNIFHYPGQTDPMAFERFIGDRVAIENLNSRIRLFVGEPVGQSPTGVLGTHPVKMLHRTIGNGLEVFTK